MNSTTHIKALKQKANKLPLTPGVYIMKDNKGNVIYIGKAKSLRNRVTQYFGSSSNHSVKVIKMVENVEDFETVICDTEFEALVLENSLIKQHQPKYNILLKDDKGYHYIKITNERWPKIERSNKILNDGAEYFGPYYSGQLVIDTIDEITKIFKIPTCNRSFDKKSKPCLNYHIGVCLAPCHISQQHSEYIDTINSAREYIRKGGLNETDLNKLREKMNKAAENLDFEYAAKIRDRISAVEKRREKQKVVNTNHKRQDIFATALAGENACVSVFIFVNGHLTDKKLYFLDGGYTKQQNYAEFLQQYYINSGDIPPKIAVDCCFDEATVIQDWLSTLRGSNVSISFPQKGNQKQLVDMCLSNAAQALADRIERKGSETVAVNELSRLLGLQTVPRRIEAYDISNTSGTENVGSMVVFIDGRPEKSLYRKFKIKGFEGQDDFRSLNEVLDRRFAELKLGEDESFKQVPDLILLDGGKGQISAVKKALENHNMNIPLFGMVKDSKHKSRAITSGGEDVQIKSNRKAFTLINNIQDEVHRVAIAYHRTRMKNNSLQLELTKINGVGVTTAKKLITKFKSIKRIKEASLEDFINFGFSERIAKNVIDYFSNQL